MNHGLSDQVRSLALEKYVRPAIRAGNKQFSVAARDLMQDLVAQGFPPNHWSQICTAIQTEKFLWTNGLEIVAVEGPPSGRSSTVVVRYRVVAAETETVAEAIRSSESQNEVTGETPEEWAHRVTGKIFGLLKDEFAEFGGGEAFLRWVRSEDEDAA